MSRALRAFGGNFLTLPECLHLLEESTCREGNKVADQLAAIGHNVNNNIIFNTNNVPLVFCLFNRCHCWSSAVLVLRTGGGFLHFPGA